MNPTERLVKELEARLKETVPRVNTLEKELELLKDLASSVLLSIINLKDSIGKAEREREKDRQWLRELEERSEREWQRHWEWLKGLEERAERDRQWLEEFEKRSEQEWQRHWEWLKGLEERAERDRQWMRKKWGEMAQRLGTLTEDILAPGVPYLVKSLGYKLRKRMLDVKYEKEGLYNQYDAMVVAEDKNGEELVFVAEVKSKLQAKHFEEFKKKLENLVIFEPAYQGKIVPMFAAFEIPEDLINLANQRGVLLVRMGGEYLEPLNPEVVRNRSP